MYGMPNAHEGMRGLLEVITDVYKTTRKRGSRLGITLMLTAMLVASAVPAHARYRYYYGPRRPHVFIAPRLVVPIVPFWAPYTYAYPPVVVAPPPSPYVLPPPPQPLWYYCDNPQGYYPYVQQCPGGWRPVAPTP
jgi:hypothetical protein